MVTDAVLRCAFCNKQVPREASREMLVLGGDREHLSFCSQNCLESYAEIELERPVRLRPPRAGAARA